MPSKPAAQTKKPVGKPVATAATRPQRTPPPPPIDDEDQAAGSPAADNDDEGIVFDVKEAIALLPTGLVAVGTVVKCVVGKVASGPNAGTRKWSAQVKIDEVPESASDSIVGRRLFKTLTHSENAMPFVHQFIGACEGTETDVNYKARDMEGRSVGIIVGYKPASGAFDEGNEITRFISVDKAREKMEKWQAAEQSSGVGSI